jgi:hypothetical protein
MSTGTTVFINYSSINTYGNEVKNWSRKASDEVVLLKLAQMLDIFICLIFCKMWSFEGT